MNVHAHLHGSSIPLRRTAAREFVEVGVNVGWIMHLCGWETRAMFDRCDITSQEELSDAVAQPFNGTQAAINPVEPEQAQ